jgi:hypothetical protein
MKAVADPPSCPFQSDVGAPPDLSTIEITVFGPAYGEGIVLHLPGIGWGVVDSCVFKSDGNNHSLPLSYLKAIGVTELAFAFLSHPHEDHYLGLDEIIESFPRMKILGRYQGDSIEELKRYWIYRDLEKTHSTSDYLAKVFNAMRKAERKGIKYVRLSELQTVMKGSGNIAGKTFNSEIKVLSPSGVSEERYADALRRVIPREGERLKYLKRYDHNLIASAFLIRVNDLKIILGSDVIKGGNIQTGWKGIMGITAANDLKAQVVKVAHHGSSGAHHQPVWSLHKLGKAMAIITPYYKGQTCLPGIGDVSRIRDHAVQAGITGEIVFDDAASQYPETIARQVGFDLRSWHIRRKPDRAGFLRLRYDLKGKIIEKSACPPSRWL